MSMNIKYNLKRNLFVAWIMVQFNGSGYESHSVNYVDIFWGIRKKVVQYVNLQRLDKVGAPDPTTKCDTVNLF